MLGRMAKTAVLLGTIIVPSGPLYAGPPQAKVSFPQHSRAVAPDGRFVIAGVDSDADPYHTVFLEDRQLGTRRKLFSYERHIDLLWNPDSKSFSLTDYGGSDYSRCNIVSVDQTVPTIQVWDELLKALTERERKSLLENHHVYIAAVQWIGASTLKVKVWGYGDVNPSGFTRFYGYDTKGRIKRLNN